MFTRQLDNNYVVREATREELNAGLDKHFVAVYANRSSAPLNFAVDENSQSKMDERRNVDRRYRLKMVILHKEEIIGWHYGYATDAETYYMQNSAVIVEHRGRGLYSELLKAVLEKLAQDGFQVVTSIHHPNNPAVLIPKLKQGFVISGMHFHERFKSVIELKLIFNPERKKAFNQSLGLDI